MSREPSSDEAESPASVPLLVARNTDHLKSLIWKSLFGTAIMTTATIVNVSLLYSFNGYEHGWLCFMCCLLDGGPHLFVSRCQQRANFRQ